MVGMLAGQFAGTAGAIGCLLQPPKKGLLHQALNSAKVAAYGGKPTCPFRAVLGPLGTFTPGEHVTATPKAARGMSLMEPPSLNP